jgi:gamma-glutamyltranspeptidase/glutathione hydrolase
VPGTVAGLIYTLEKYGSLKLKDVIQPAIDLAENGFILDYKLAESFD